jgi:hypothetical protein
LLQFPLAEFWHVAILVKGDIGVHPQLLGALFIRGPFFLCPADFVLLLYVEVTGKSWNKTLTLPVHYTLYHTAEDHGGN